MKNLPRPLGIVAAFAAALLSTQTARAALTTWNATGGNWSVDANWDTLTAPGAGDDVRFLNVGAGTPNIVDANFTINSLTYGQDNGGLHTTAMNPGQPLTVNRNTTGDVLYVGSTSAAITSSTQVPVAMTGAGPLTLSGTGDLVVRQGHSSNGSHMATLDLSGLDTLNATVGRLLVGQANAGAGVNRPSGTLILAKTNVITLSGASPQVMIQDGGQNANGSLASVLSFGQVTDLYGDVMRFGGQKGNANINFNASFASPSLQIRNADGFSAASTVDFGYNGAVSSGNNTVCVADLSLGTVDVLANLVHIAQGNPGPSLGACTATLTLGAGTFDANTLEIGYGNATGASGATTGTMNINNNGLFSSGALLVVDATLRLARTNGGAGTVTGTLNVNGGTVLANSIVAGGGNSVINLNGGSSLTVSNSAGTLAAPIASFSISDAALNLPASNAGAAMVVKNLAAGGSQNTINITAIPPISSYPATFALINYQTGASGNFVLGTLPPASPAYSGYLIDLGDGVVSLQLTSGPVVDLTLRWTGANDNTWDSFSLNWLYQGNPSAFFAGAATFFNDNTTQSNIFLAEALAPGSVTVSNNLLQYTFTGSGNIAGASLLAKQGSRTLIVENTGVNNFATVVISGGTLQLGSGGTDGSISALNITNNGALVINRSGSLALSSAIAGTGTLTKSGDGTLTLSGANSYSGASTVTGGTLIMDGTSSGTGPLTTSAGTVLAGSGSIDAAVTVGGQLNPGPLNGPGTFRAHGGLTLASGSTLAFDLSATDPSNPTVNDSVEVFGDLNLNNNTITVNISGTPQPGASYLLFTYSGNQSGNFNPVIAGTHFAMALDTSNPGLVYLNVTGGSGANLRWDSPSDSAWDSTSTNWLDLNSSAPSVFYSGDSVLLDDSPVVPGLTIASGLTVSPLVVTNNSTNNSFTISGAGRIGGSASIVKAGPSTLVLGTPNNFTGTVDVEEGTLQTDNDTALGTTAGGTTIHDGATLNLNGHNLGGEPVTVSGAGVGGQGAIVNTGGAQFQAFRTMILAGDTTFGGSATWAINNGGGGASLSTGGNPFSLTKVGVNQVNLAQVATVDPTLADIDIQQGTLEFSGLTSNMGDPSRTNTVHPGGTLSFANGSVVWNKQFLFFGDGTSTTVNNGTGANSELAGPIELHGGCVFNVGGTAMTLSGLISGDGGLIKNGASPIILNNANTYTGDTLINTAALRLNDSGSISGSTNIVINAGATLTATGRVDSTFTLAGGQTLKGNGVVNGIVVASAGSTVAPGLDAVGALTVSNAVTLSGTIVMELDAANGTNDVLRSNGSVTYGGTLQLVNVGGPLASGSSFKLFYATSYPGSFNINPPTPGPGQTWDISALGSSGTITVAGSPPAPRFSSIVRQGSNLVMSGTNAPVAGDYYVLASTNLALPFASWQPIATNAFDGSGSFAFTNSLSLAIPRQFYLIQIPLP